MDALPEMPAASGPEGAPRGKLATNIVHFARTLRTAGLRVGPGQVLRAIEARYDAGIASPLELATQRAAEANAMLAIAPLETPANRPS